ncbi:alpha/beta hydrolase [Bradyrhizobium valentinum]|uniref:alpha/beta hydrolase n=1 Tax=Bradyrhizobium valentinum TaxID=1518501 RepID=UPI0012E3F30F|nr:alpha/beta hydrolase [Bradyrhizobium valentinum]
MFLDNVEAIWGAASQQDWIARWTSIGNAHCSRAELDIKNGDLDEATEAWLSSLTAFEVARRLLEEDGPQTEEILAKMEATVSKVGRSPHHNIESVEISTCEPADLQAYYLSAGDPFPRAPSVICISSEDETRATLLARLMPAAIGRGMSVLVVSHDDVVDRPRGRSGTMLSCCVDYLSGRSDVDADRIGVYGEGLSAALATDLAVPDRRVAAAVCDGGLWNCVRMRASVDWMTRTEATIDEDIISARRLRLLRRLGCPVLVVAGGRSIVSVSEALKLQTDCFATRIDLELAMPRMIGTVAANKENFVVADDCIFSWLERKLTYAASFGQSTLSTQQPTY